MESMYDMNWRDKQLQIKAKKNWIIYQVNFNRGKKTIGLLEVTIPLSKPGLALQE